MSLTDILRKALANSVEASLIAQSYHWNVEGLDFNQYHDFFGDIYEIYYSQVDRIAEYVRIASVAKEYVNGSISALSVNKTITADMLTGNSVVPMVNQLLVVNQEMINTVAEIFSNSKDYPGINDWAAAYLDTLNKLQWKLKACSK